MFSGCHHIGEPKRFGNTLQDNSIAKVRLDDTANENKFLMRGSGMEETHFATNDGWVNVHVSSVGVR